MWIILFVHLSVDWWLVWFHGYCNTAVNIGTHVFFKKEILSELWLQTCNMLISWFIFQILHIVIALYQIYFLSLFIVYSSQYNEYFLVIDWDLKQYFSPLNSESLLQFPIIKTEEWMKLMSLILPASCPYKSLKN